MTEIGFKDVLKYFVKVFISGSIILIIIAFITNNPQLVYPSSDEDTNAMIFQIFILGIIYNSIKNYYKKHKIKKKN